MVGNYEHAQFAVDAERLDREALYVIRRWKRSVRAGHGPAGHKPPFLFAAVGNAKQFRTQLRADAGIVQQQRVDPLVVVQMAKPNRPVPWRECRRVTQGMDRLRESLPPDFLSAPIRGDKCFPVNAKGFRRAGALSRQLVLEHKSQQGQEQNGCQRPIKPEKSQVRIPMGSLAGCRFPLLQFCLVCRNPSPGARQALHGEPQLPFPFLSRPFGNA